jgi:hypothetical protein
VNIERRFRMKMLLARIEKNLAWVSEHIIKPILAPIFKNFGIVLK